MKKKQKTLKQLKKRFKELKPITTKGFKTSKELQNYKKKNIQLFEEYYEIGEKILQLEWELMSPEEQEKQKKRDKFLELKSKGEPFDLSEFEDL